MTFIRFMTFNRSRALFAAIGLAALVLAGGVLAQRATREFEADMKRLVPALEIRAGSTVADIGAGGGELTFALAKEVGASGRVYTTEIDKDRLERLRENIEKRELTNVTALEARASSTNLPAECCDAIVVRFVYHHFDDPSAMNRSLLESLKPGGRIAIIDFAPDDGRPTAEDPAKRDEDGSHGVDADTVAKELAAVGFERIDVDASQQRSFMAVFQRPAAPGLR